MANWLLVILTLVIALFTYLVWKTYERIAWLTGAMETHSELMLRVEAKRGINGKPIKLVAWDPTIERLPVRREHGQEIEVDTIHFFLPLDQRRIKPPWWKRALESLRWP
jgi:hypothetical protein